MKYTPKYLESLGYVLSEIAEPKTTGFYYYMADSGTILYYYNEDTKELRSTDERLMDFHNYGPVNFLTLALKAGGV